MVFADAIAWGFAISFWACAGLAATRIRTKQIDGLKTAFVPLMKLNMSIHRWPMTSQRLVTRHSYDEYPSCLHRHSALSRASSRRLRPGAVPWAASDPGDGFGRAVERPRGPVLPAVASKTHGPAGPASQGTVSSRWSRDCVE